MNKPSPKTPPKTHHKALGSIGEKRAEQAVFEKGLVLVARNWRFGRRGELDLVAFNPALGRLHIIEVKTRHRANRNSTGSAIESITPAKQAQLRELAEAFLNHWQTTPELQAHGPIHEVSLDVITLEAPEGASRPTQTPLENWVLTWHENAF
jgi:putative endonuclease